MKYLRLLLLFLCCTAKSATYTASSLSESNLLYWSTHVADGDTVIFPSGSIGVTNKQVINASITAAVVWTNAVNVLFHEPAVITNKMSGVADVENYVFRFQGPSNAVSRIAGVTIDGSSTGSGISVGGNQNVRVDHCNFRYIYGRATMFWGYRAYGLVDHCTHLNCRIVHEVDGDDYASWEDPLGISTGSTNCVVFESNSITYQDANWVAQDMMFYNGQGAKVINRYNVVTSSATGTNAWYFDCHGNQEEIPGGTSRGTIYAVLVSNTVSLAKCPLAFGIRGGQFIAISNNISVTSGSATVRFTEEEGWNTAYFPVLRTNWPAGDQITNSFFFANSFGGAEITTNEIAANYIGTNDQVLINLNRDYWITNGMPPVSKYTPIQYPLQWTYSSIITAASSDFADVSNAVAAAKSGDTVVIPAGASVWASTLTVTNPITILGNGTNSTLISGSNINLLFITGVNGMVRVSALSLSNNPTSTESLIRVRNSKPFRIDRCLFHYGIRQIHVEAYSEGLVDYNTFKNGDISVGFTGDGWASWVRPIVPSTTNTTVLENNAFIYNLGMTNSQDHTIYHQDGGRSVTRFNTFDSSAMTNQSTAWFDSHGNWNTSGAVDPSSTNSLQTRGQPLIEVYGNSFTAHNSYGAMGIRSGSMLFFSNTIVELTTTPYLRLTEEEGWQTALFSPLRTNWPPGDGASNTFIWANTINGSAMTTVDRPYPSDTNLIALNRDYWFQAPNTTNGSPAGIYYPYTILTYPHPMATAQDGGGGTLIFSAPATANSATVGRIQ